jgi:hypothetical protein
MSQDFDNWIPVILLPVHHEIDTFARHQDLGRGSATTGISARLLKHARSHTAHEYSLSTSSSTSPISQLPTVYDSSRVVGGVPGVGPDNHF